MRSRVRTLAALAVLAVLAPTGGARGSSVPADATPLEPNVALRAHLGHAVVSLERGCPPPGLLACRPGVRVTASLPSPPPPWVRVAVPAAVAHGLRVFGYRDLVVHAAERGFAGRVAARGEVLGRWQQSDEILEIAVGGLELRDPAARREELERGPALALDPAVLAALERDASP